MSDSKSCCSEGSCSCQKHQDHQMKLCKCGSCSGQCECQSKCHSYSDQLLHLADQAWEELLKDKIKEEILAKSSANLTELAKLVSETNHKRWKALMSEKGNEDSFKDRLRQILEKQ